MNMPPNVNPPLPPAPPAMSSDPVVERQLARLYGESLFGTWQDPLDAVAAGRRELRRGRWGKRFGILLLLVAVAAGGTWLYLRGLDRRAGQERAQVAKDVATFLADGELDRLAQFLEILEPPGKPLQVTDPYLDLIVSAEAAVYRYHDAAPARLARIEPYLSLARSQPARLLAYLTVVSRPERAYDHEFLASLATSFAKDPEYHTLMATMLKQRGDIKGARASWERSAQAGPLWLPHRYLQCAFEARQHNAPAVSRIASHMAKVAPESAWTRLAFLHFTGKDAPTAAAASGTATETSAPNPPSPVAQYYAELAGVFPSLAAKDLQSARQALGRALAAVHGQAPFVLDAFAALLDARAEDLALELTSYEAWPRSNRWAQAKLAELQAAVAERRDAVVPAPSEPRAEPSAAPKAASKPAKARKSGKAKGGGLARKKGGKANRHRRRRRR